jgi:hypothetical protein
MDGNVWWYGSSVKASPDVILIDDSGDLGGHGVSFVKAMKTQQRSHYILFPISQLWWLPSTSSTFATSTTLVLP